MHLKGLQELIEFVEAKIEKDHKMGHQAGGSGHMGYVIYTLRDLRICPGKDGGKQITYWYTIFVETEFTYEPDNPPYEYNYCKKITVTENNTVIDESCTMEDCVIPEEWAAAKRKVIAMLRDKLLKSGREDGRSRVPVKFPPLFIEWRGSKSNYYICVLEPDRNKTESPIVVKSGHPEKLPSCVSEILKEKFNV